MADIKIKRSSVEGKIPLTTDLQLGELAINTYDGKLFLKRNNGVADYITEVGGNRGFDVKNQTGTTLAKGTLVQFAGTLGSSGKLLVAPFLANGTTPSDYFMGVVLEDIPNGGDGFVVDHGKIYNINTSAYVAGTVLYASATTAGAFSSTQPQAPNNKITVAAVINSSATAGILEVRVTLGSHLGRDELVELSGLGNNDTIAYNSTAGRFENTPLKTINGSSLIGSGDIAISGTGDVTLTGTQTLTNKTLTSPVINTAIASGIILNDGYTEEVFAVSGTTPALSPTNGSIQTWTLTANSTPTAGTWNEGQSMTLMIDDGSAYAITWTSLPVTWETNAGTPPVFAATGYTPVILWKVGTTIYGARVGDV